jgi:hypothetical protein
VTRDGREQTLDKGADLVGASPPLLQPLPAEPGELIFFKEKSRTVNEACDPWASRASWGYAWASDLTSGPSQI